MKVLQFPLVRITIFFVSGIVFAHLTKPSLLWIILPLLFVFLALVTGYFSFKRKSKPTLFFGGTTLLLAFLVGNFTLISSIQTHNPNHYIHQLNDEKMNCELTVKVNEKLKTTPYFERYVGEVITLNNQKSVGKLLLNIHHNETAPVIEIGSLLKVKGVFQKHQKALNPDQFDYGCYLENQQIYAQFYTEYNTMQCNTSPQKSSGYYASKLRNTIIYNLEKNGFNKAELSVVTALILGQQQDISKELIRDYQYAGAIHILSVSGLHVGLILMFVTFLLQPIPNTKRNSLIKLLIVVASLWGFGILAGLAPSVVRSVTMFSFVAIGMFLRRSVNIYHTLLVSILLILLFRPSFLFDVGFQLSYLALFFIIWLQPFLALLWQPKNKIALYFWDILTVSFAAQIGTLPLSIYYFHQFPGLFFVTNLIVLPMLSIIMAIGVLVMVLASVDWVWIPLLKSLQGSIWVLNKIIGWVASFEDFILKDIPFNGYLMAGSYLLIFSVFAWLSKPTYKKLVVAFFAVIIVQVIGIQTIRLNQQETEFIVFNCRKKTVITERNGTQVTVFTDGGYEEELPVLKSYLVNNFGVIEKKEKLQKLYYSNATKVLLIDSSGIYKGIEQPDVLLLTHSPRLNLERLFDYWKPKQVVVDASNFKSYVQRWKATCEKEKIPFHDTSEKGFYKL